MKLGGQEVVILIEYQATGSDECPSFVALSTDWAKAQRAVEAHAYDDVFSRVAKYTYHKQMEYRLSDYDETTKERLLYFSAYTDYSVEDDSHVGTYKYDIVGIDTYEF
jgi:hypothetical protein